MAIVGLDENWNRNISMEKPIDFIRINNVMGLPPTDDRVIGLGNIFGVAGGPNMHDVTVDSLPILEIMPCFQQFASGLQLYKLVNGLNTASSKPAKSFVDELAQTYRVTLSDKALANDYIRFAYLNLSPPVESFSNDFEESIFTSLAETSSRGFRQGAFIGNVRGVEDAKNKILDMTEKWGGGEALGKMFGAISDVAENSKVLNTASNIFDTAFKSATGRVDFPQFWRSSSWDASYNINIRLYNPHPGIKEYNEKYIIAPLATLLMFVVPRSDDGITFHWPWLCKFRVKGLFDIDAGYVRSIQVVKGGDDNNIAMNQQVGIVDVKLELGTLYKTMVASSADITGRPVLNKWLDQFNVKKEWADDSNKFTISPDVRKEDNAPFWARHPVSDKNVSVASDLSQFYKGVDGFNYPDLSLQEKNAAKIFEYKVPDRPPEDQASRKVQSLSPRIMTEREVRIRNTINNTPVKSNIEDLIDITNITTGNIV